MQTIHNISIPLISVLVGGFITYYFTSKTKKYEAVLKFKEEKYTNLLIHLQGFVGDTTSYNTKKLFFEEQYSSWVYASDEVVVATNNMITLVIAS